MTDLHVEAVRYRLVPREGISFRKGLPSIERDLGAFTIKLKDDVLTVTMRDHFESTSDAEDAVQPYLQAWRAADALVTNRRDFEFEYVGAEVIDRDPAPPGSKNVIVSGGITLAAKASASVSVELAIGRGSYPAPPDGFALDLDTETLWNRWQGYIDGRESIQSMAYFCLTVLRLHGGDKGAATRFSVSRNVLPKIRRLSNETGDLRTARKATPNLRPLTEPERVWLEAAVKALVRRAGEVAAAPQATLPQLTMSV